MAHENGRDGKRRLQLALKELTSKKNGANSLTRVTAKELCEKAGISRNSLYLYHSEVLGQLKDHNLRCGSAVDASTSDRLSRLQADKESLRLSNVRLATLVDHYFCAWREAVQLLERRDRELAETRQQLAAKVVPIRGVRKSR